MLRKAINFLRHLWAAEDLRNRILITMFLLVIYRIAAHIPVPGVDPVALRALFNNQNSTVLGFLDLLSGGTLANFSVLAMGPYPYITAQIILQLVSPVLPGMANRQKEDPQGYQRWMERWTYYVAVPMAALQSLSQIGLYKVIGNVTIFPNFGWNLQSIAVVVTMTAGTMFAIWLGELISEYGLKNQGLSLIIFAGIVSRIPSNFASMFADEVHRWTSLGVYTAVIVSVIFLIIIVQQGRRNIPVMYPGRRIGFRQAMPVRANLPLMVNMAGMIPLIFAGTFISMPAIVAGWVAQVVPSTTNAFIYNAAQSVVQFMNGNNSGYWVVYFALVVIFTFFYTDVQFTQANFAENLRRSGAQIPGVTSGDATQKYLTKVMRRITFPGAFFLGLVAVMPFLVRLIINYGSSSSMLLITSSGLLIVVGVVRELYFNLEAELKLRGYDESLLVK
jgi:preprotein translocase subunit SecY